MAVYLDTSALLPLFFAEPASESLHRWLASERQIWVSRWTLAEFASASARKLRTGKTDLATANAARDKLAAIIAGGAFMVTELERADLEQAARLCEAFESGLRTPDALHAAIANRLRLLLLTADKGQAAGCTYHAIKHQFIVTA